MFSKDFHDFLSLLNKHEVEYLIVGANAVSRYGHPRYTGDLDIWINKTENNSEKMLRVIHDFGFASLGLTKEDFSKPNWVSQLGHPPIRIDILTDIDGVLFNECYSRKNVLKHEGLSLNYIHYDDLKKNKLSTGRKKDEVDIEEIEKAMNRNKNK